MIISKQQNNFAEVEGLSAIIEKSARSLHSTIGYISTLCERDFYNINVKDVFKLALSDITNPDIISNLGLRPNKRFTASDPTFAGLADLMFYTFAVRMPFLRRLRRKIGEIPLIKDKAIKSLYITCAENGANDLDNIVGETFAENAKIAKSKFPEPAFTGEWFRRWIYHCASKGTDEVKLSTIDNKNIFLIGCMDALFPLYYAKLIEILEKELESSNTIA
ncbi:MAG: hypothetical protein FWF76_01650 [Oscillospiraceae bacterium]|nr:hypothetical protein [Oscillospiraceae bacterium]